MSPAAGCACSHGVTGEVLGDIQAELREHGITAELHEIGHALLEALGSRPALCRGLFAEYMLEEN